MLTSIRLQRNNVFDDLIGKVGFGANCDIAVVRK